MGQFIKTLIKTIFWAVVFPLLALFVIVMIVFNVIPQTKLRTYAADEIGRRINRQMEIGPLHLRLRGLTVDSLKLSEIPSFKKGILLTAKGIHLGWDLRSLWECLDVRKGFVTRSSGRFAIDDFRNPHYTAHDFSIRWSLSDIDATGGHLNGWAKLEQGPGTFENIDKLMATSPTAKIALAPVMALINVQKLGIVNLGLPDFRHWPIDGIHGDYTFKNGLMTIHRFAIDSSQMIMGTAGTVNLANGALLLDTQVHSSPKTLANALDINMRVTGTISKPHVDMESLKKKAFKATINNAVNNSQGAAKDIDKTLKDIFH